MSASSSLESISASIVSTPGKREKLRKALEELQTHSSCLASFNLQWKDLEEHLDSIQKSIERRFEELKSMEEQQKHHPCSTVTATAALNSKPHKFDSVIWPSMKPLCIQMDARGLRSFIVRHRKDGPDMRGELDSALRSAPDPAQLVLDAMVGFFPARKKCDKDVELASLRRACIFLLESLVVISPEIKEPVKERAKKLAFEWKGNIREGGDSLLEGLAFFQLIAAYGLFSLFDTNELLDVVVFIARRKQTIDLCRTFGLKDKIPDLVQRLINKGRHLDAINYIYAFELVDKFPPVPLIEDYLDEAKKVAKDIRKRGNHRTKAQNEATVKEITAMKAVIKSVQDHNLESEYSCEDLEKTIAQLEKKKADRKRGATTSTKHLHEKPANKRQRPASGSPATQTAPPAQPSGLSVDRVNPYSCSDGSYGFAGVPGIGPSSAGLYGLAGGTSITPASAGLYGLAGGTAITPASAGMHHPLAGGLPLGPSSIASYALVGRPGAIPAVISDRHQGSGFAGAPVGYGGNRSPSRSQLHSEVLPLSLYDKTLSYGGYSSGNPPQYRSSYYG